jgi:hypothetical protein
MRPVCREGAGKCQQNSGWSDRPKRLKSDQLARRGAKRMPTTASGSISPRPRSTNSWRRSSAIAMVTATGSSASLSTHGLRVPEACDLRWDDIDLGKRTIAPTAAYLERDEHKALGDLWRANAAKGLKSGYVFVNERGAPFGRMAIGRMIERAGEAAPTADAKSACSEAAIMDFKARLAAMQQESSVLPVESTIAVRRLEEDFCYASFAAYIATPTASNSGLVSSPAFTMRPWKSSKAKSARSDCGEPGGDREPDGGIPAGHSGYSPSRRSRLLKLASWPPRRRAGGRGAIGGS